MNSTPLVNNIDDCYKALIRNDYWEECPIDRRDIIKFLDEFIANNPKNARAYYLRSMAKFHLIYMVPPDYFWRKDSEYAKDKIYNDDEAWEDYNIATNIDPDIVSKNQDIRIIMVSYNTGLKYYFRKPCPFKVFEQIMKNSPKEYLPGLFYNLLIILFFISMGMAYFYNIVDKFIQIVPFFVFVYLCTIIYKVKNDPIRKLHKEYCEKVVNATYDEWHG